MSELTDIHKINILDTMLEVIAQDHPEYSEEDSTGCDLLTNGNIWLEELKATPNEEEIAQFKVNWGQTHQDACWALGYQLAGADELLIVDFFWDPKTDQWLNKESSLFTEREQLIADYLRGN